MKAFSGFKSEASSNKFGPLPAGPYVAQIKKAKVDGKEPDQTLILRLDVTEGEFANYFTNRYNHEKENAKYEPRYKGDYKIRIPNDDNKKAQYPDSDKRRFNDMIWRIEKSNPGYHWDWNEKSLEGLTVGINMQSGEYNGSPYTRIGRLEVADDVRKGIVPTMKAREPRSDAYEPPKDQQTGFVKVEEDTSLPWF